MINIIIQIFIGIIIADLISGLIHWLEDEYGNADWPIVGSIFEANQNHHTRPLDFLKNTFIQRNLVTFCIAAFIYILTLIFFGFHLYLLVAFLVGSMSNEIHAYTHRKDNPKWVLFLQKYGIMCSPISHAAHHRNNKQNYFAVTSWLNWLFEKFNRK